MSAVIFTLFNVCMGGKNHEKMDVPVEEHEEKEKEPKEKPKGIPVDAGDETPEKESDKDSEKSDEKESEGKEEISSDFDLKAELEEVRSLSNADLMKRLFEKLSAFLKRFSDGSLEQLFGLPGAQYTKKEVDNIKVDVESAEKQFEKPKEQDKGVKFVCDALNLPVAKDANALLLALRRTEGMTYEQNPDQLKPENVHVGDVLFFRKEGEPMPYLTTVVSAVEPEMMMKYVDEQGNVKEEAVLKSDLYPKEWFGLIRLPQKEDKVEVVDQPVDIQEKPASKPE